MIRVVLLVLSILAFLLASRRFSLYENVGYDIGALFLLLIGIQLLIGAAVFHEHHESRSPKPSTSGQEHKGTEPDPPSKP